MIGHRDIITAMPELPEVQTVVTTLRPYLVGAVIRHAVLNRQEIVTPIDCELVDRLTERTITAVDRRGKRIVVWLDDHNRFYFHLGMTGRLTIEPATAAMRPHTHLVLEVCRPGEEFSRLRFRDPRRFGGIWWLGTDEPIDRNIGPEPLTLRPKQLADRLGRTTRAIKNALLDQSVVAGLGNIYVDEALHRAGIHPLDRAMDLPGEKVAVLNRAIKSVLNKAIRHRGSTLRDYFDANGNPGGFQKLHTVYGREGQPCRSCKLPIERIVVGGRSTHFCRRCQVRHET